MIQGFDNRRVFHQAPSINALTVRDGGGQILTKENPRSWEDRAAPDYLGERREMKMRIGGNATPEELAAYLDALWAEHGEWQSWCEFD